MRPTSAFATSSETKQTEQLKSAGVKQLQRLSASKSKVEKLQRAEKYFWFRSHVAVEVCSFTIAAFPFSPGKKLSTMGGRSTTEGCTRALSSGCFRHFM
jgi:hypothetical protein